MWMLMLNFYVNVICFDLSPRPNWIYRLIYLSLLLIYVYVYIYNVYILSYYSYLCSYLTLVSRLSVWLRFRFNCSIVFVVGLFVWLLLYCLTDSHTHTHTHFRTPCTEYTLYAISKPSTRKKKLNDTKYDRTARSSRSAHVDKLWLIFQRNLLYCTPKNRVAPCPTHRAVYLFCSRLVCSL